MDESAVRFCRTCSCFLPLNQFPKGKTRYTCKRHWIEQISNSNRERRRKHKDLTPSSSHPLIADEKEHESMHPPLQLLRRIFQKSRKNSTLFDIFSLYHHTSKEKNNKKYFYSMRDVHHIISKKFAPENHSLSPSISIVPRNPLMPWDKENAHVCLDDEEKTIALFFWRKFKDAATYEKLLSMMARDRESPSYSPARECIQTSQ
jgi:hypothetical protein